MDNTIANNLERWNEKHTWPKDGDEWDGQIGEVAMWDVALTDAEVLILSKGFSPLFIRRANLKHYWTFRNGLSGIDIVGGFNLTAFNTPTHGASHPPIIYPAPPHIITAPAVAAARRRVAFGAGWATRR